jgi:hypothetical protein
MKRYQQDPDVPSHLRTLLRSAKADDLDAARRQRVATRLGVAPPLATPLSSGAEAPRSGPAPRANVPRPRLSLVTMAVGAVALLGAASVGFVQTRPNAPMVPSMTTPASSPAPVTMPGPITTAPIAPSPPIAAETAPVAEAVPSVSIAALPDARRRAPSLRAPAAPAAPVEAEPGDLHAEIIALQAVRAAIVAGEPREALTGLDAYGAKFRAGKLREEASVLRIEALAAAGEHEKAQRAADRLLEESPNTVYAARVRTAVSRGSREQAPQ